MRSSDSMFGLSSFEGAHKPWKDCVTGREVYRPSYRGSFISDDEVADLIRMVPAHYANVCYTNAQSSTGTATATAPAATGTTWNLSSLIISQAGPTVGPNAKVTIYDGAVGGTVLFAVFLSAPGAGYGGGVALGGSVGVIQDIPLPRSPQGVPGLQGTPGNAMNIQVTGTGVNVVSINARLSDGLP